jgi:hypothetical protein
MGVFIFGSLARDETPRCLQGENQASSSGAGFFARLGWTRIGSPGTFGEETR